jgi:hypothetical protein
MSLHKTFSVTAESLGVWIINRDVVTCRWGFASGHFSYSKRNLVESMSGSWTKDGWDCSACRSLRPGEELLCRSAPTTGIWPVTSLSFFGTCFVTEEKNGILRERSWMVFVTKRNVDLAAKLRQLRLACLATDTLAYAWMTSNSYS